MERSEPWFATVGLRPPLLVGPNFSLLVQIMVRFRGSDQTGSLKVLKSRTNSSSVKAPLDPKENLQKDLPLTTECKKEQFFSEEWVNKPKSRCAMLVETNVQRD